MKNKKVKLNVKLRDGNFVLDRETFEHFYVLMATTKLMRKSPSSGISLDEYEKAKKELKKDFDDCIEQSEKILKKYHKIRQEGLRK